MSKRITQSFLGIDLFTFNGFEQSAHQDITFNDVKWCFKSMKQFDGRSVVLHRSPDTLGNISITDGNWEAKGWIAVSLLRIPEFREALFNSAAIEQGKDQYYAKDTLPVHS